MDRSTVRILIVDDEPFILKLHAQLLRDLGFGSGRIVESGALALGEIDRGPAPDLILLDLAMPGMDGIEFMNHLASREFRGSLVVITGEDRRLLPAAARLAQACGLSIAGQLSKPVTPATLGSVLDDWERRSAGIKRPVGRIYASAEIQEALSRREIFNYYQPKICLKTGVVRGVECLARWRHPGDGLVLPDLFIGVAERSGLIGEMGRLTMTEALSDIRDLRGKGFPLRLSVNVSARTLGSLDFAIFAAAAAAQASVEPRDVILEVTESQLIADPRTPLEVLARLRIQGFGLSIDDFGTGYSSLAQLRDLPFDELKIDRRFVHHAPEDSTSRAIYDASLTLARSMGIRAVAEGVEDRADWDLAYGTGCDEAQGYLMAHPMPVSALPAWCEEWEARRKEEFAFA